MQGGCRWIRPCSLKCEFMQLNFCNLKKKRNNMNMISEYDRWTNLTDFNALPHWWNPNSRNHHQTNIGRRLTALWDLAGQIHADRKFVLIQRRIWDQWGVQIGIQICSNPNIQQTRRVVFVVSAALMPVSDLCNKQHNMRNLSMLWEIALS